MAASTVSLPRDAAQIGALLASAEISGLITDLQLTRWTGRPGYPLRSMVGLALVKSLYALPTWTRAVNLVRDHAALRAVLGAAPSDDAAYRFTRKLREHKAMLDACTEKVIAALREAKPDMGQTAAIDGSDMPAYANGHKHVGSKKGPLRTRFADPDAGWGHRSSISTRKGGAFFGYKLHLAVCTRTELPLAWIVKAANESEQEMVPGLLDAIVRRGFAPGVAVLDKGYDGQPIYDECESRGIRPVIALKGTPAVKAGKHKPPSCQHGEWLFAGSDAKRGASKWRCPTGECTPASQWVKADRLHPLIPHGTDRWKAYYRQRTSVERGFGRLKTDWGLLPLRVRRIHRVQLHADLCILTQLASALAATRDT
jgi:transposase, IS5 family